VRDGWLRSHIGPQGAQLVFQYSPKHTSADLLRNYGFVEAGGAPDTATVQVWAAAGPDCCC
jgi:hypothetical protein